MSTRIQNNQSGITLLITLLLMGVLLGIGATLLNITLKQLQLSSIALESEIAFQAANAGVECALYYDFVPIAGAPFDVPGDLSEQDPATPSITCMGVVSSMVDKSNGTLYVDPILGNGKSMNGGEQRFQFEWSGRCSEVSVYKFYRAENGDLNADDVEVKVNGEKMREAECPEGSECTVIQSRGYNVKCSDINTGGRVVEREYTQVY